MTGVRPPLSQCTEAEFLNDVMRHLQSEEPSTKLIPVGGMPSPHWHHAEGARLLREVLKARWLWCGGTHRAGGIPGAPVERLAVGSVWAVQAGTPNESRRLLDVSDACMH